MRRKVLPAPHVSIRTRAHKPSESLLGAYLLMAYLVMAYLVMAYLVMAI